ncbi:MAG: hypothetical protein IJU94_02720 [Clostridia bacterium]|nr:hypothetical protein [Clostridia bacterium]
MFEFFHSLSHRSLSWIVCNALGQPETQTFRTSAFTPEAELIAQTTKNRFVLPLFVQLYRKTHCFSIRFSKKNGALIRNFEKPNQAAKAPARARTVTGAGTNRNRRAVIYYRFVGYLEIPDEQTRFSEDTRQGVSVEYISCAPIKVHYGDDGEETEEGG